MITICVNVLFTVYHIDVSRYSACSQPPLTSLHSWHSVKDATEAPEDKRAIGSLLDNVVETQIILPLNPKSHITNINY